MLCYDGPLAVPNSEDAMYDAIVVGARCGGSPTAMLLARRGYRVLLVDKSTFPSDIMSTHYIHQPGVERLRRWGLLERVLASNCPPIPEVELYIGGERLIRPPDPAAGGADPLSAYCPRRIVLDKILVDGAVGAGAEMREAFTVDELVFDGETVTGVRGHARGGEPVTEQARLVIGADGMHSKVAKAVAAPEYNTKPSQGFGYYAYWSNVPLVNAQIHFGDDAGMLLFPTNDEMICVAVGGPDENFHEFRKDIEGNYMRVVRSVPDVAERMKDAKREEPFIGTNDQPNFFRRPYGAGWALVGDAGYHRDFVTGLGITDAFRDAEFLAQAADEGLSGRRPIDDAMADYERKRNEIAEPLYDLTLQLLSGEQPSPQQFINFGLAMARMMPAAEAADA